MNANPVPAGIDSLALARDLAQRGEALAQISAGRDTARALFEEVLALRERRLGPDHFETAHARSALGGLLCEMGDYAESMAALRRTLETLERALPTDSVLLGSTLNTQGRLFYLLGNYANSRRTLERAIAVREAKHGPNSREVQVSLNNLANVFSTQGDLARTRPIYERLVHAVESATPVDSVQLGIYLHNLANVVSDQHDYSTGRALYERALAVRKRVHGPIHPRVAMTYQGMSSLAEVMHDDPRALAYMDSALTIFRATLGEGHPLTAEMIIDRAGILIRMRHTQEAFGDALLGERLTREHLRLTARSLPEANALEYESSRINGLDLALRIVASPESPEPSRARRALDAVVRSRSLLLDEMAARRRTIATSGDSLVAGLEAAWARARTRYAELAIKGMRAAPDSVLRRTVEAARRAAQEAEARLAQASAKRKREDEQQHAGFAEVAAALPGDAALVSYVRYTGEANDTLGTEIPHYLAFVTRTGVSAPTVVELGNATGIDSLVRRWRDRIVDRSGTASLEPVYRRAGFALRARIWDPLISALRGADRVFVVPDGSLHLVSFYALPSEGGRYLVETGPLVHYLSTERDLLLRRPMRSDAGDLLALGGADFDHLAAAPTEIGPVTSASGQNFRGAAPSCAGFRAEQFTYLRGSDSEARDVAELWKRCPRVRQPAVTSPDGSIGAARAWLLLGPEASEDAFKRLAPRSAALHVATHGYFVSRECLAKAGADSAEDDVGQESPLVLSGLVLAGANRRWDRTSEGEDGLLTAEEVGALDLSGADWVVVSACESGVGEIVTGEGIFGLRRAFQIAGVGSLVMSLWPVDDTATRRWMRELYEAHLERGLPAPEAVRRATLAELRALRAQHATTHVAKWGAFISCGDWH